MTVKKFIKYTWHFLSVLLVQHLVVTGLVTTYDVMIKRNIEWTILYHKNFVSVEMMVWSGIFGAFISYAVAYEEYLKDKKKKYEED